MSLTVTLDLPDNLVQDIQDTAQTQRRSIADVLRELVLQSWRPSPELPDEVEAELRAMANLSDDALWLLARSSMKSDDQDNLAVLNQQANLDLLDDKQVNQREGLLEQYDQTMIRRAQAAALLQKRGYDLSDPRVLQAS